MRRLFRRWSMREYELRGECEMRQRRSKFQLSVSAWICWKRKYPLSTWLLFYSFLKLLCYCMLFYLLFCCVIHHNDTVGDVSFCFKVVTLLNVSAALTSCEKNDCHEQAHCIPLAFGYECRCNLGFYGSGKQCFGISFWNNFLNCFFNRNIV